jgi:hypothetical protein
MTKLRFEKKEAQPTGCASLLKESGCFYLGGVLGWLVPEVLLEPFL